MDFSTKQQQKKWYKDAFYNLVLPVSPIACKVSKEHIKARYSALPPRKLDFSASSLISPG